MKKIRMTIGHGMHAVRYVIEDVEGEPRIRREDEPAINRDSSIITSSGRITVERAS